MERIVLFKDQRFEDVYKGQYDLGKLNFDLYWSKTDSSWWVEIRTKKHWFPKSPFFTLTT